MRAYGLPRVCASTFSRPRWAMPSTIARVPWAAASEVRVAGWLGAEGVGVRAAMAEEADALRECRRRRGRRDVAVGRHAGVNVGHARINVGRARRVAFEQFECEARVRPVEVVERSGH